MPSRSGWDAKYRREEVAAAPGPDPFLVDSRKHLPADGERRAADVACGGGRHALLMAAWGLRTTAIDYSAAALRLCRQRARRKGLELETRIMDLEAPDVDLGASRFDVVAVFNFLHRPLVPVLKRSVRPGGIVVYKTYTRKQLRFGSGPRNPRFLLDEGELAELFSEFHCLQYRESCEHEATAALVAQRP